MTPGARYAAATQVLDAILAGQPPELALTSWARSHRFAGSGDRAALRDHVFDALRRRNSLAALGGGLTGRGLMLGLARSRGEDALFTGEAHAPPPPSPDETPLPADTLTDLDCPAWLAPSLQASLGEAFVPILQSLQQRAPVYLRVNPARASRPEAQERLSAQGIIAAPVDAVPTALVVTEGARKIRDSEAYLSGAVELQDLSSQDLCLALPVRPGAVVLDYCAGGGGKTLALAARARMTHIAHDADPGRMKDLPARAARAGVKVALSGHPAARAPYDLVLTDVPCSGSGSWRRDPAGKWALTPARLAELARIQAQILDKTAPLLRPGGTLAYATCSLLADENEAQVTAFLARHPGWTRTLQRRWDPRSGGDGFFLAMLTSP